MAPPRLIGEGARGAETLRRANRDYGAGASEPAAFARLHARLVQQRRVRTLRIGLALAAAVVAATVVLTRAPEPAPLTAEKIGATRHRGTRPQPSSEELQRAAPPEPVSPSEPAAPRAPVAPRRSEDKVVAPARTPAPLVPAQSPEDTGAARADVSECLQLARRGERAQAEECFRSSASGSGLAAELALYELARLRRDLLDDPGGALSALDEHRRRFPGGGLHAEVELTRVELLVRMGRPAEALVEVERLLASSTGKERNAELVRIRDRLRPHSTE